MENNKKLTIAIVIIIVLVSYIISMYAYEPINTKDLISDSFNNEQLCIERIFNETGIDNIYCDLFSANFGNCECYELKKCIEYLDLGEITQKCIKYNKEIDELGSWIFKLR